MLDLRDVFEFWLIFRGRLESASALRDAKSERRTGDGEESPFREDFDIRSDGIILAPPTDRSRLRREAERVTRCGIYTNSRADTIDVRFLVRKHNMRDVHWVEFNAIPAKTTRDQYHAI